MSWEVTKYRNYARECMRLAEEARSVETRNKLIELAQVWSEAAVLEQEVATRLRAEAEAA